MVFGVEQCSLPCEQKKTAFIDGTCNRPTVGHATLHQWERCNAFVFSWIMNNVSKDIFGGIVYSTDASVVWTDLKEQFDKVNAAKQYVEHEQRQRLLQFLLGLNESYSHIRSRFLMMSQLPTVGKAFSIISQEESHRSMLAVEAPSTAFFSNQNRVHHLKKDMLKCDHCNWNGNTKETCYKLVGYPPGHRLYKPPIRGSIKKVYKPQRPSE
ncbi:uncharacterized protein LOC142526006 [Primulina tabacum]|uniref:uncharacterized protein LOC142526006 n=1 Tax=Primulina tabacum TaxID=48773 RepID=UPI003F59146A